MTLPHPSTRTPVRRYPHHRQHPARLFTVNALGCLVLIVMASVMGFETSSEQAIYLATTAARPPSSAPPPYWSRSLQARAPGVGTSELADLR